MDNKFANPLWEGALSSDLLFRACVTGNVFFVSRAFHRKLERRLKFFLYLNSGNKLRQQWRLRDVKISYQSLLFALLLLSA